jgi:CheY-like chemotaxis protein/two-component sensor histidine kinase
MINKQIDLRVYRPAAILVVDLIKHSQHKNPVIHEIQQTLHGVFREAKERLSITRGLFKHTGDGYFCAFLGDDAGRVVDFINYSFPRLSNLLKKHEQHFRAGLDFGMVHLTENDLTGGLEHFDLPSVHAARLEAAAPPDQILCTETIHAIFSPLYPGMFTGNSQRIQTKDREILSYVLCPVDLIEIRDLFMRYLFPSANQDVLMDSCRTDILVVDDEPNVLEYLSDIFEELFPQYKVVKAYSGEDALVKFEPNRYAIILTDIVMPGTGGMELTRRVLEKDPKQVVVMITGYATTTSAEDALKIGVFKYMTKPFSLSQLKDVVQAANICGSSEAIRAIVRMLSDDPGRFLLSLQTISCQLSCILRQVPAPDDIAHSLLRHKARHIVQDVVDGLSPGNNVLSILEAASAQLKCIDRLSRIVGRATGVQFSEQLEQLCRELHEVNSWVEIQCSCTLDSNLSNVVPFASTMALIICELIDNAISAIEKKGRIQVKVSLHKSSNSLFISVADSGPGVKPEIAESIFKEGVSSKGPGRGLGLTLVKNAVEALGGSVSYVKHEGAVFQAAIPLTS